RESKLATSSQGLRIRLKGIIEDFPSLFRHGDPNHDGKFDIADAIRIVMAVVPGISGGSALGCPAEGDLNGDDLLDLPDAVYYLNWQFRGGPRPAAPFPACGTKPGVNDSDCRSPLCP